MKRKLVKVSVADTVGRYKPSPEDQLLKAFLVLDSEGKGYLTQEELTKYMTEEGNQGDITA